MTFYIYNKNPSTSVATLKQSSVHNSLVNSNSQIWRKTVRYKIMPKHVKRTVDHLVRKERLTRGVYQVYMAKLW